VSGHPQRRVAFLLAQIGADASSAFDRAVEQLGITASEAGLLRLVGRHPGISQKAASEHLGVGPSRVVAVLDRLEADGHLERRRSVTDRRTHELTLTPRGEELLARLRPVAEAHEKAFTAMLPEGDLDRLAGYLEEIAEARHLDRELHRQTTPR
jgi:DNA-binding MarR family transcriptional regulator